MKTFLKYFIVLSCLVFSITVFAKTPSESYNVTIQPISEELKSRTIDRNGPATDIVIINYTDYTIVLSAPTYNTLPSKNSARVKHDTYSGETQIRLTDASGREFFNSKVWCYATVSVTVVNGQYTIKVT